MYLISLIFSYFFVKFLIKRTNYDATDYEVDLYAIYALLAIIIGSRVFYVLFYNPIFFLNNPLEIFMIWHGGLSFHGGLIATVAVSYWFCKRYKKDFLAGADMIIAAISLCLAFGRIGNFINGELYGRITAVPWAVKFPGAEGFRHPSQLYEAAKNVVIFSILSYVILIRKKYPKGFIFSLFLVLYGSFRFFIEFFREPDPQIGLLLFDLTMGQILCLIMIAAGSIMMYWIFKTSRSKSTV